MPKCASQAVENMLRPYCGIALLGLPEVRHTTFIEYARFIKPYLKKKAGIDTLETICLVREPLSWLHSWYRYRSRCELRNTSHPKHKNSTAHIQFSEFVEAYLRPSLPPFTQVHSQFHYLKDEKGGIGVDTVFLYEDLADLVTYMSHKIGRQLRLSRINVSPKRRHESDLREYLRHKFPKLVRKLTAGPPGVNPPVDHGLGCELLGALREFLRRDFELYEMLKTSQRSLALHSEGHSELDNTGFL